MVNQVTIAEFVDWSKAHIARSRLEAEGIPVFMVNQNMNTLYGGSLNMNIILRVPAEAAPHAMAVMADLDFGQAPMEI